MNISSRKIKYYYLSFVKYDFRASITLFFIALPLCLGISLACNAPLYSGLLAGIIGGVVVSVLSKSNLSVSGPAAGLTAICAAAIIDLGSLEGFFLAVTIAGMIQLLAGALRLGGFTHFIPSSVIKGMLAAIGILLVSRQIPLILGYDQPDFWIEDFLNVLTFQNIINQIQNVFSHSSVSIILISVISFLTLIIWKKFLDKKISFVPASFVTVVVGSLAAFLINHLQFLPSIQQNQIVSIPSDFQFRFYTAGIPTMIMDIHVWKTAFIIAVVASLETLLSVTAIDKLDPYNRVTPQNRELIAQGTGNVISGLMGGLPITAVIVRSAANAEAGAKTKLSAFTHGLWILLAILFAIPLLNYIPYAVLAVLLLRTGYNLAKPRMITSVYKQGREQFLPFIVTVIAILVTDLLLGVVIGCIYAIYFLIKHTYRAGYVVHEMQKDGQQHYQIDLALNVSFLNKKRFLDLLDAIPENSVVEITGTDSVYIDRDILEIFHDFKSKARIRNIDLTLIDIPDVETIELH